jgi:hypothetical protein
MDSLKVLDPNAPIREADVVVGLSPDFLTGRRHFATMLNWRDTLGIFVD